MADVKETIQRIVKEELDKFRIEIQDMCMAAYAELNDDSFSDKTPRGYLSRHDAAIKFNIHPQTLSTWHKDKTVHTVFIGRLHYYNEADIKRRVKARKKSNKVVPEGYLLFAEVAGKLGLSLQTLRKKVNSGQIKGSKRGNRWLFAEDYINRIYEESLKYLNYRQVAQLYGVSEATIYQWAKNGRIPAERVDDQWRFRKEELPPEPLPLSNRDRKVPIGYLTSSETAAKLNISMSGLQHRVLAGRIKGEKIGSYLYFRKSDVEAELKLQTEFFTLWQVKRLLHIQATAVNKWIEESKIPYIEKYGTMFFLKSDIENYTQRM